MRDSVQRTNSKSTLFVLLTLQVYNMSKWSWFWYNLWNLLLTINLKNNSFTRISFWPLSKNSNKRTATLIHWACPLNNSPKADCGTATQQVEKAEGKEGIQIYLGFNIKILFFSLKTKNVSLTLCGSSEHLQDTLITKLPG